MTITMTWDGMTMTIIMAWYDNNNDMIWYGDLELLHVRLQAAAMLLLLHLKRLLGALKEHHRDRRRGSEGNPPLCPRSSSSPLPAGISPRTRSPARSEKSSPRGDAMRQRDPASGNLVCVTIIADRKK